MGERHARSRERFVSRFPAEARHDLSEEDRHLPSLLLVRQTKELGAALDAFIKAGPLLAPRARLERARRHVADRPHLEPDARHAPSRAEVSRIDRGPKHQVRLRERSHRNTQAAEELL